MTIIPKILTRWIGCIRFAHLNSALRAHIAAIRWRRRMLRSLNQRRRG